MKKIFLDANIIIDLLDKSSLHHDESKEVLRIIRKYYGKPYISPPTFAIAYYVFGKTLQQKKWLNKTVKEIFSTFNYTEENQLTIENILSSNFSDYEDALQYFSAFASRVNLIVTRNIHDFYLSEIPVLRPNEFIEYYYSNT